MTAKASPRNPAVGSMPDIPPDVGLTTPWTRDEHVVHIQALGQRVARHVQFICEIGKLQGTSAETKDNAVIVFYKQLLVLERQLNRIHEDLELA
ncbi:MAG TPA: hypothetical protein VK395_07330 [Gemmataceae bacterium]|nr:hypothetical protein [Gemmataceae bacterium]